MNSVALPAHNDCLYFIMRYTADSLWNPQKWYTIPSRFYAGMDVGSEGVVSIPHSREEDVPRTPWYLIMCCCDVPCVQRRKFFKISVVCPDGEKRKRVFAGDIAGTHPRLTTFADTMRRDISKSVEWVVRRSRAALN